MLLSGQCQSRQWCWDVLHHGGNKVVLGCLALWQTSSSAGMFGIMKYQDVQASCRQQCWDIQRGSEDCSGPGHRALHLFGMTKSHCSLLLRTRQWQNHHPTVSIHVGQEGLGAGGSQG